MCVFQVQGLPLLSPSVRGKINLPVSHITPSACYAAYHQPYLCLFVTSVILSNSWSLHPSVCVMCFLSVRPPVLSLLSLLCLVLLRQIFLFLPSDLSAVTSASMYGFHSASHSPPLLPLCHPTASFPIIHRFCFSPPAHLQIVRLNFNFPAHLREILITLIPRGGRRFYNPFLHICRSQ